MLDLLYRLRLEGLGNDLTNDQVRDAARTSSISVVPGRTAIIAGVVVLFVIVVPGISAEVIVSVVPTGT
jgi:hypothetical protein